MRNAEGGGGNKTGVPVLLIEKGQGKGGKKER